jgi:hypothetical protein
MKLHWGIHIGDPRVFSYGGTLCLNNSHVAHLHGHEIHHKGHNSFIWPHLIKAPSKNIKTRQDMHRVVLEISKPSKSMPPSGTSSTYKKHTHT